MNSKKYNHIDDFLQDESFISWVEQSSAKDIAFWGNWLVANPDKKSLVNEAAAIVKGIQFAPNKIEQQQVEEAMKRLNRTLDHRIEAKKSLQRKSITRRRLIGIAASLAVLLFSYFANNWYQQSNEVIYQTAYGEQLDLKLADGTEVALNANSTLRFFSKNAREVWLEGEAFFKVEKKLSSGAKFWVHTSDLNVEVLGTAFNVNSLKSKTQVMLEEGKVKLNLKNGSEETMQVGELFSYSNKEKKVIKKEKKVSAKLHTSWKDGVLNFKDISLAEAMQKVEATYGVEVIFEEAELAKKPTTIAIPTKNLEICIHAIQKAMEVQIKQNGNQLLIFK